jgi:hypothetical protein
MGFRLYSKPKTGAQHGEAGIVISIEKRVAECHHPQYRRKRESDTYRISLQFRN